MQLQTGFLHPQLAEASLPISIPDEISHVSYTYQIISSLGQIIRRGCFKGCFIHISTRLLPKGEHYVIRIANDEGLIHEGRFQTY